MRFKPFPEAGFKNKSAQFMRNDVHDDADSHRF
jgi:hypothetical protein